MAYSFVSVCLWAGVSYISGAVSVDFWICIECAFGPFKAVEGLMGCVQSKKLGARASPSEVYLDGKLQ